MECNSGHDAGLGLAEPPEMRKLLLFLLVLAVYVLHQDFWWWREYRPLVFGFLPIGLAYHAGFSILAAVMMALLVKFAWPKHFEKAPPHRPPGAARENDP